MIVTAWFETASAEVSSLRPTGWKPTSTAITMSTPMRLRDVDRQVLDDAAVHQQAAVHLDRREHARRRHARAHRGGQVAAARARCARRSRGPPRPRETASAARRSPRPRRPACVCSRSVCVSRWPWIRPRGTRKLPPWMPSGKRTRNSRSSCLRRKLSVLRAGRSRNAAFQSMPRMSASISSARHARGIEPADDGAHAGARDGVDRDAQLLERLQHADVREPARAAAGQHEPDARPRGRRRLVAAPTARGRQRRQQQAK